MNESKLQQKKEWERLLSVLTWNPCQYKKETFSFFDCTKMKSQKTFDEKMTVSSYCQLSEDVSFKTKNLWDNPIDLHAKKGEWLFKNKDGHYDILNSHTINRMTVSGQLEKRTTLILSQGTDRSFATISLEVWQQHNFPEALFFITPWTMPIPAIHHFSPDLVLIKTRSSVRISEPDDYYTVSPELFAKLFDIS